LEGAGSCLDGLTIQAVGQNVLGKIQAADDVTRDVREVEGKW
jgi:hypothetical protein